MPARARQPSARPQHPPARSPRAAAARWRVRARRRLRAFRSARSAADWRAWIAAAVTFVGAGCAVYLCFRGSGELKTVPWLPRAVGEWADQHGRFRNLPAFFLLACPAMLALRDAAPRWQAALALGTFGTLLECGERFVPGRWVEWQDVAWSWAGVGLAWLLFTAIPPLAARCNFPRPLQRSAKPQPLP